jgi:hypothetical protein
VAKGLTPEALNRYAGGLGAGDFARTIPTGRKTDPDNGGANHRDSGGCVCVLSTTATVTAARASPKSGEGSSLIRTARSRLPGLVAEGDVKRGVANSRRPMTPSFDG